MTATIGREVVNEGLRLADKLEAKLKALRETIEASIAQGGRHTVEDVEALVDAAVDKLRLEKV